MRKTPRLPTIPGVFGRLGTSSNDGFDGSWVAHPGMVELCTDVFTDVLGDKQFNLFAASVSQYRTQPAIERAEAYLASLRLQVEANSVELAAEASQQANDAYQLASWALALAVLLAAGTPGTVVERALKSPAGASLNIRTPAGSVSVQTEEPADTGLPRFVQVGIDAVDIATVRQVLDEDHYGLDKIKDRVLEYLAVRKLKQDQDEAGAVHPYAQRPRRVVAHLQQSIVRILEPGGVDIVYIAAHHMWTTAT